MENITEIDLDKFSEGAIKKYIAETVCNRALPGYQDGLKPIQRKILWAMYKLQLFPNLAHKKSAKVSGEVMAKYSPHADCYPSIANMAQVFQKYNFVDGLGNWGSPMGDIQASSRYTECRLSELASVCLLDKNYLDVVPYVDNYDGTEKEPVYLPARLPFILLLNSNGIATAVRTGLPSFDLKSLCKVCIEFLQTNEIAEQVIPITTINNGKCLATDEELLQFFATGSGTITFGPNYNLFSDRIEIVGIQDDFDFEKVSDALLELNEVKAVKDEGDKKIKIVVYFNGKLDDKQLNSIFNKLKTKTLYSTNILSNQVDSENQPIGKYHETTIYGVIKNWCKFRCRLERDYLNSLIEKVGEQLQYQNTLLLAANNLKIIFSALQSENSKQVLIEKLSITENQANIILDLPVKRLTKLSGVETENKIEKLNSEKQDYCEKLKDIKQQVVNDLKMLADKFG